MSKKILAAYFSAGGVTAKQAKKLAEAIGADLFEIKPEIPYTQADLDWTDKKSRSTVEMNDPSSRPGIADKFSNIEDYGIIFLGFPIWWYMAPTIINTFLESYDFSRKTIIPFATSGGSGMERVNDRLQASCPGAELRQGRLLNGNVSKDSLKKWMDDLNL